jgi:hypothetical protein
VTAYIYVPESKQHTPQAQNQKIGKPKLLKGFGEQGDQKKKGPNMIAKIG